MYSTLFLWLYVYFIKSLRVFEKRQFYHNNLTDYKFETIFVPLEVAISLGVSIMAEPLVACVAVPWCVSPHWLAIFAVPPFTVQIFCWEMGER